MEKNSAVRPDWGAPIGICGFEDRAESSGARARFVEEMNVGAEGASSVAVAEKEARRKRGD